MVSELGEGEDDDDVGMINASIVDIVDAPI
jgi:hypothetical protein